MSLYSAYIIDDNRIIRESLIKTINWLSLGVQVAGSSGNGSAALDEIRSIRPDIVVTDIRMPGCDGLTLTQELKTILPATKVIVITGFEEFEYARKALRAGAVDIILKPIRNEELERAVGECVRMFHKSGEQQDRPGDTEYPYSPLVKSVLLYIDSHLGDEISLEFFARLYKVTPSHLSRTFKKEKGTTFLKYLTLCRIQKSKELLSDPGVKIYEIAETCGFHNPVRFSQVFKQIEGVTPMDFRRNIC